jgi:hypothetical protein
MDPDARGGSPAGASVLSRRSLPGQLISRPKARLIDGRTIFYLIHYVEPVLHARHRDALRSLVARKLVSSGLAQCLADASPVSRALVGAATANPPLEWKSLLRRARRERPLVCATAAAPAMEPAVSEVACVQEAVDLIEGVRLRFFVDFAIGAIDTNPGSAPLLGAATARVPCEATTLERAEALLRAAVRESLIACAGFEPFLTDVIDDASPLMEANVLYEFHRRLTEAGVGSSESRLDELTGSVTAFAPLFEELAGALSAGVFLTELLCLWYPGFDRFRFFCGSPFLDRRASVLPEVARARARGLPRPAS